MRIERITRCVAACVATAALISATRPKPSVDVRGPAGGETAGSADAFLNSIGSNAHPSYTDRPYFRAFSTIVLPRLREVGIKHLRIGGAVVPDDAWMRKVYDNVNTLYRQLRIKYDLVAVPAGKSKQDSLSVPFDRLFQFMDPASVDMVEGLNEPDYPDRYPNWVQQASAWQRLVNQAVKSDPRLAGRPVVGPALVHGDKSATALGDLTSAADLANIHPYPGGQEPSPSLAPNVAKLRAANGSLPYIATESGYHTAVNATHGQPGVSELAMGKYIPRLFFEYWNFGIRRTYQYELLDEGTDPTDPEAHFGLVRFDGTPKPAFTALKNVVALVSDPSSAHFTPGQLNYSLSGTSPATHHTLLEKADGRFYLALWQEVRSYDLTTKSDLSVPPLAVQLKFDHPVREAKIYRPLHGPDPTADQRSIAQLALSVPDEVIIVEITP
jgi:hypothetical protein